MKQAQKGFTLIELVMVIVILGVLAAVALPKFVDLKGDAQQAAMSGVAGAAAKHGRAVGQPNHHGGGRGAVACQCHVGRAAEPLAGLAGGNTRFSSAAPQQQCALYQ